MIEYWSEDHEVEDLEAKLKNILGDKLIGYTTRGGQLIEVRVKTELTSMEHDELKKLRGKAFKKVTK